MASKYFRVGDRLICVDAKNSPGINTKGADVLVQGREYRVVAIEPTNGGVFLDGIGGYSGDTGWSWNRFELAPATPEEHVNHPAHYGGDTPYEAIKVIEAWGLDFHLGTVVKYIARHGKKSGEDELKDLRKARWYLDRRIQTLEQEKDA